MRAQDRPVFIVGVAGTGKTRLGSILGRHSRLSVTRKTYLWREFYGRFGDLSEPANLDRCLARVLASPGVQRLDVDPAQVREEIAGPPTTYGQVFGAVHRIHAASVGKPRWGDQLGLAEMFAEPIFADFPSATMIHLIRDPRSPAVVHRAPGWAGWMIGKWSSSVELADRNRGRYHGRYLVVRQEDMHDDEESVVRDLCRCVGEPFEPSMMQPPVVSQECRRRDADAAHIHFVETKAGPLMRQMGYCPDAGRVSRGLRHRLVDAPLNAAALVAWREVRLRSMSRRVARAS